MEFNYIGAVAAVVAFLSIWVGHVAVRKIEAVSPRLWIPMLMLSVAGIALEGAALSLANRFLSMASGMIGMTLLWDAFELKRQATRVHKGHAPANPNNPRHAAILASHISLPMGEPKA